MKSPIQFFLQEMLSQEQWDELSNAGICMDDFDCILLMPYDTFASLNNVYWESMINAPCNLETKHIKFRGKKMVAIVAYHS